jgi:hypothetical protein
MSFFANARRPGASPKQVRLNTSAQHDGSAHVECVGGTARSLMGFACINLREYRSEHECYGCCGRKRMEWTCHGMECHGMERIYLHGIHDLEFCDQVGHSDASTSSGELRI